MEPISNRPAFEQKTLFFEAGGRAAILVTNQDGRRHETHMQFNDAHEALNWCLSNHAGLVMVAGDAPSNC